jgi:hypothetical protein
MNGGGHSGGHKGGMSDADKSKAKVLVWQVLDRVMPPDGKYVFPKEAGFDEKTGKPRFNAQGIDPNALKKMFEA